MSALARGWLIAWTLWAGVPVGALVLLMIHAVTGGRWGDALGPVLRPAALLVPLAGLGFLGVAAGLPRIYPWAADPAATVPDVARLYLAPMPFLGRAALALVGWSILAVLAALGRLRPLAAGLGLAFYGLTISLVAVDWLLSLEPRFTSSAFAVALAIQEMLSALALAALVAPATLDDEARARDLANLLLAVLLGLLYLDLMAFIVAWYGDLPPKADWYGRRGGPLWGTVIGAAALLGGAVPFALLLLDRVRRSRRALRPVGALVLTGVALRVAWLVLPAYREGAGAALAWGVVGLAALVALSALALRRLPDGSPSPVPAERRIGPDVEGHATGGPAAPAVAVRPIVLAGLGAASFVALALVGLRLYAGFRVPDRVETPPRPFPAPQLQAHPDDDLAALRRAQAARLEGYAWVDREAGVARVPVARAMEVLAARGAAAYAAPVQPERTPTLGSRGGAAEARP